MIRTTLEQHWHRHWRPWHQHFGRRKQQKEEEVGTVDLIAAAAVPVFAAASVVPAPVEEEEDMRTVLNTERQVMLDRSHFHFPIEEYCSHRDCTEIEKD